MRTFEVYKMSKRTALLSPLTAKREWADDLPYEHVYKCFPLTLANQFGWGISFPEDISFKWNGKWNAENNNIEVFSGSRWVNFDRGWGIVSFNTGLIFKTDSNLTMLGYPVPNNFIDGFQIFTYLISTSFFQKPWQLAGKITDPNKIITIKAGTPVGAIMPVPLSDINNSQAIERPIEDLSLDYKNIAEYGTFVSESNKRGEVNNFYRDGVDHLGNKLGDHEVKSIKLRYN